jgi:integrase
MARVRLTAGRIRDFTTTKTQEFLWDSETPGLAVRATANGAKSYIFQGKMNAQSIRVTIGDVRHWDIENAGKEARSLQNLIDQGIDPRQDKAEKLAKNEEIKEEQRRKKEEESSDAGKLSTLMALYCAHLKKQGKSSWQDVQYLFDGHVTSAFPAISNSLARSVTSQQFREVLAKLTEAGKGRTAGKLRSYLKAAYSMAMKAEFDPTAPAGFLDMRIDTNPIDRLPALSQFNIARERALSWPELHSYIKHLEAMPDGGTKDLLMTALIMGGQRPDQLSRLQVEDVDLDGGFATIYDPKGKRQQARAHNLPLSDLAIEIIRRRMKDATKGDWLFSSTHGRVKIRPQTTSQAVDKISDVMVSEGSAKSSFRLSDLRRTAETLLAGMGVSKDIRAQLQSHGLSGVQQRHYDKHEYMDEKRATLSAWENRLFQREATNVIPIMSKAAA